MSGDAGDVNAAALEVVRGALRTGDLAPVGAILAPGVVWFGAGPRGGCRSRAEVLATLHAAFAGEAGLARPELHDARLHGDHAVLQLDWPDDVDRAGSERWYVLSFDEVGLIDRLQGYDDEAVVEHDLALRAAGPPPDEPDRPAPAVSGLVPFIHVADMARSLAFYRLLGLEPVDSFAPHGEIVWAFVRGDDASLMLGHGDTPVDYRAQGVLFYLYAHDLAGLRDHLVAHGVTASAIADGTPGPREEMSVADPDGYVLMIAQIAPDGAVPG